MIRSFGLVLLLAAVTACTAPPAPQAIPTTTTTTTTTTAVVWPRFDTPRRVEDVDTCTLLEPGDFADLGTFAAPPLPYDEIPGACVYQVGDDTPDDLIVTLSFWKKYEEAKAGNPQGGELLVDGHTEWISCGNGGKPEMQCVATVAVNADRTLVVGMALKGGSADQLAGIMSKRVRAVLKRLPTA